MMKEGVNEGLLGEVLTVKELTTYQEGSVVSRTLMDKNEGTVTMFSFSEGQGLSEHTTPFDAMAVIVDGEVEISIDGSPNLLKEGEMIIMPANHPHALRAVKNFKMMLVMIRAR